MVMKYLKAFYDTTTDYIENEDNEAYSVSK